MKFPLTLGLQKTGLPLILTSGRLANICFLIDTGSTHNIIFDFVYEHFKSEFRLLSEKGSMMGFEGCSKPTELVEATFNFEGQDYTSRFSILDASEMIKKLQEESGVQIHGILGIPFLIENKWIIDFNKLELRND